MTKDKTMSDWKRGKHKYQSLYKDIRIRDTEKKYRKK